MKKFCLSLLCLACPVVMASNLCELNQQREEEFRIKESDLTKENAQRALNWLQSVVVEGQTAGEWVALPNQLRVIEGYVLRRDALESKSSYSISAFCTWMNSSGWWYE